MQNFAMLFPGQGAQYVGMGSSLLNSKLFFQISSKVRDIFGFDFEKVVLNSKPDDMLDTTIAQPLLLV